MCDGGVPCGVLLWINLRRDEKCDAWFRAERAESMQVLGLTSPTTATPMIPSSVTPEAQLPIGPKTS